MALYLFHPELKNVWGDLEEDIPIIKPERAPQPKQLKAVLLPFQQVCRILGYSVIAKLVYSLPGKFILDEETRDGCMEWWNACCKCFIASINTPRYLLT